MSGTTRSGNAAYFDANVWLAYVFYNSDLNYSFASMLINKMCKGEYFVYVSDLVIMETVSALRRKIPSRIKTSTKTDSGVREIVDKITRAYLNKLDTFKKEGNVINKNPDISVDKLHNISTDYLTKYFGSIGKHDKQYRYRGLNHWDIQHALIARSLGAETFYTADSGFEELKNQHIFDPMEFVINAP